MKACWLMIAIGCSHPGEGQQPMTQKTTKDPTEAKVTLEKPTELDGGGQRLAVTGALVAVGTDEDVRVWRDREEIAALDAPGGIDRLRFGGDGKELLAAPYALDLGARAWAQLPDLEPALTPRVPPSTPR